jgi:hypothetical protein
MAARFSGGFASAAAVLQVAAFWHIRKVASGAFTALQPLELAVAPGVSVQVPTTTPLLNVPVVVVVPLEVPVSPSGLLVSVSTLPVVEEVIFRLKVPVTCPAESVVNEALPVSVWLLKSLAKQVLSLKNPNPVILSGPLLVTLKETTKFSRLAWPPLGLISWASQLPVVDVLVTVDGVLFAQPQTANSSANRTRIANLLMNLPWNGDLYENREMRAEASMDVRRSRR